MGIELTYRLPFKRLQKLGRTMGRRAYSGVWWARWIFVGGYGAALLALSSHGNAIALWLADAGLAVSADGLFLALMASFLIGLILLRRFSVRSYKARADYDQQIRLVEEDEGLRIATDHIEYFLKWSGITQMLVERDGVVVSHGNLFFLIPDTAFASPEQRLRFVQGAWDRMSDNARDISARFMRPVLEGGARA